MNSASNPQVIIPPKQKRGWRTRQRLVRAATRLFSEKGYDSTTTNQISKRAGVSVGIFYKYFRDKREIFLEIYRNYSTQIERTAVAELDPKKWRRENIREIIRSHLRIVYESHKADPGLLHAFGQIAWKDAEFQSVRNEIRLFVRKTLENLLRERSSEICVSNIPVAAFVIDEAVEACIHQNIFFDASFDQDELLEELARMVTSYIICSRA
jgi:AcrR family transcriptional regulator